MRRLSAIAMVLALVAVACKIETNVVANLNADGSGTVTFEVGFDEEAQVLLQGEDPTADFPEGADISEEERDGLRFFQATLPFSTPEELTELMLESGDAPFDTFSVSFSDTSVTVAASASGAGGLVDEGDLELFDQEQIEESFAANVRITMPGKVVSSNADETDGSTLVWSIPLFGGDLDIQAESDPSQPADSDGGGGLGLILAIVAIVVLGGGAYLLFRNRRAEDPDVPHGTVAAPVDDEGSDDGEPAEPNIPHGTVAAPVTEDESEDDEPPAPPPAG